MSTSIPVRVKSYFRINGQAAQRWEVSESAAHPVAKARVVLMDAKGTILVESEANRYGNATIELKAVTDGSYRLLVQAQEQARSLNGAHARMTSSAAAAYRDLELSVNVANHSIRSVSLKNPQDIHGSGLLSGGALSIDLKPDYWRCESVSRNKISPDVVIIHHTGTADIGAALNTFKNKVGPHFILDVDGFVLMTTQCSESAGHAGISCWKRVIGLNASSIGIEIIHSTGPYLPAQYERLVTLLNDICLQYKIPKHHVIGHQDIATSKHDKQLLDPRRAADPGPEFDWSQITSMGFGLQLTRPAPAMAQMYDGAFAPHETNKPKAPHKLSKKHGTPKAIAELQDDLDAIGYSVKKTGVYDKHTEAAVKHFELHFDGRSNGGGYLSQSTALKIKRCILW